LVDSKSCFDLVTLRACQQDNAPELCWPSDLALVCDASQ
jgi:hypothetical protein